MKKIKTAILLLMMSSSYSFAQSPIAKGQAQINIGLGLSNWGIPVYAGLDYGIHKDITLGAEMSFRSYNDNYRNTDTTTTSWVFRGMQITTSTVF